MERHNDFVKRALAYQRREGISSYTVSERLFGNPTTFPGMLDGKSCRLDKFEVADARLTQLERAGATP